MLGQIFITEENPSDLRWFHFWLNLIRLILLENTIEHLSVLKHNNASY